jgi:Haloacid dehalogenase-like hydrolase
MLFVEDVPLQPPQPCLYYLKKCIQKIHVFCQGRSYCRFKFHIVSVMVKSLLIALHGTAPQGYRYASTNRQCFGILRCSILMDSFCFPYCNTVVVLFYCKPILIVDATQWLWHLPIWLQFWRSFYSYFELNMSVRLSCPEDYEDLLEKYDTWMFDCDGVIWSGDHSIDGAIQALDMLRSRSMSTIMISISLIYLEFHIVQREKGLICDQQCYKVT